MQTPEETGGQDSISGQLQDLNCPFAGVNTIAMEVTVSVLAVYTGCRFKLYNWWQGGYFVG